MIIDDSVRVNRGGSWNFTADVARVAYRFRYDPSLRLDFLGFRLSRLVNPLEQLSEVCDEYQ